MKYSICPLSALYVERKIFVFAKFVFVLLNKRQSHKRFVKLSYRRSEQSDFDPYMLTQFFPCYCIIEGTPGCMITKLFRGIKLLF